MNPVQPRFSRDRASGTNGPRPSQFETRESRAMKVLNKLQNPFALVAQGFVLGGLIFFATHAGSPEARAAAPAQASLIAR